MYFHLEVATDAPCAVEFRDSESRLVFDAGALAAVESRPAQISVSINKGTKWKDAIGGRDFATFFLLLSEKAAQAFENAGLTGYEVEPVRIDKIQSKALRDSATTRPWYSLLKVIGKVDLDFEASGIPPDEMHAATTMPARPSRPQPSRLVFTASSEGQSDFAMIGNYRTGHIFCSEQVVSVAREHGLTNFRFTPSHLLHHQKMNWAKGVDYLGRTWPPRWEPPHAREQKPLADWLAALRDGEREPGAEARPWIYHPLMDFGLETVPGLFEILRDGTMEQRQRAARLLYSLRVDDKLRLPKQAISLAEEFMPEQMLPTFRKAG